MRILAVTLIFIFSTPLFAEEEKCWEAPNTIERSQCHGSKLERLDVELNNEYKDAIATLRQPTPRLSEEEFRAAQRLWLKFVESDCELEGKLYGGASIWQSIEYMQCKEKYLKKRIHLFKIVSGKVDP